MNSPVYIQNMSSILPAVGEPDYKSLIPNPSLRRRMSRVVKMGVACALDCLAGQDTTQVNAIITATGLGCMADTEKFMNNFLDSNEQLLNPTPFIQSTFNTVGAQIALLCKNQSYNMTYAHRGLSFESALLDAMLRISEGDKCVLAGAFDEITPTSLAIQQRLGQYRHAVAGEGSQFFLLCNEQNATTKAAIYPPCMFTGKFSKEEIEKRIGNYLQHHGHQPGNMDFFVSADPNIRILSGANFHAYKELCGEYHTASAFALYHTVRLLMQTPAKRALIYNQWNNHNHSLVLVENIL